MILTVLMAFLSIISVPRSISTSTNKCDLIKDSYINLCGNCVEGFIESQDSKDFDDCAVCSGSNDCMKCEIWWKEGCESAIFPRRIDLALNQSKIILHGSKLKGSDIDGIVCFIRTLDDIPNTLDDIQVNPSKDELCSFVTVESSVLKTGPFNLKCALSKSNDIVLNSTFNVVDSRSLKILSITPQAVPSNAYFKVSVNLTGTAESNVKLLCFAQMNSVIEYVVTAVRISPGLYECSPMMAHTSSIFVGIAETLEAVLHSSAKLNMREIVVRPSPVIKASRFSSDLRQIIISFDQNIKILRDCSKAFSPETISLFGKGWDCQIRANQLIVQLGVESSIQPGSRISLSSLNDVQESDPSYSSSGLFQGSTTVVDDTTGKVVEPVYHVLAPHVVCFGMRSAGLRSSLYARKVELDSERNLESNKNSVTTLEVQQLGAQSLYYNWSVTFNPSNENPRMSQRDMLMIWLSVRLLDKSVRGINSNKVTLNNSLMLSNVDYTVTVRGTNSLGMSGEEKRISLRLQEKPNTSELRTDDSETLLKSCSSGLPLDVTLSSPPATYCDTEFRVEVSVSCCNGNIIPEIFSHIRYIWTVKSSNGSDIKLGHFQGKHLKVSPGVLHGGERYEVACNLYHKSLNKSLGHAKVSLITLERGIQPIINVSAVGASTKQPIILDASASRDLDNKQGILEFEWSCRIASDDVSSSNYGDHQCYLPSKEKRLLNEAYHQALQKPILYLPPGCLPIGRYFFSVKIFRNSASWKPANSVKTVEVTIVGGSPPLVFIPSKSSVTSDSMSAYVINPDEGATLTGCVKGIKAGCHISWKSVDLPGYIKLNQSLLHQELYSAEVSDKKTREFPVELSAGLVGDAKYRLRLSAMCSTSGEMGVEISFVDVDLLTDAPPVLKPLMVEPHEGEALVTTFRFSTQPAYDDLLDYPLRYSFGFRIFEEGNNSPGQTKFFHSSNQVLSVTTYLPALSPSKTKIQSVLRVCDVRQICQSVDGPLLTSYAPTHLTTDHVELLSDGFSSFLMEEEYEDAIMLVESSMVTLEVLNDKSLYQLASKKLEKAVNDQLDFFEIRLNSSPESVNAALRFLKAANTALKHGTFSQETLQRLVAFKDKILSMLSEETETFPESQRNLRRKRQASMGDPEQTRNVLQPEMVRTLLSVSEVAIFNLSDTRKALNEKQKLLQNVSFFMESLCRGLRSSVPLFIGSRVVSFSVQRLNMQVKYKDELAIPDWRSAKSGGAPLNATGLIRLGENVQMLLGPNIICMGAAYYPMDFLSEVSRASIQGLHRHSSVYYVKLIHNSLQKATVLENYNGLDIKAQTVRVKIPIWDEEIASGLHLECRAWMHGTWDSQACKLKKLATLINKPAVECLCHVIGYFAVFAVESPATTSFPSTKARGATNSIEGFTTPVTSPTLPSTAHSTVPSINVATTTILVEVSNVTYSSTATEQPGMLPPGVPIPNTSQNFTFKIQEDFSAAVGANREAFIAQIKQDLLKQVEMPANMIASIDVAPGSILVTLHLVDTDIRTVDDVLPSLAAILQDGHLSVNGVDGRHLSVPPQSLKLLQHRVEQSFVPWIVVCCTIFGVISVGSLIIAAILVKRQLRESDFVDDSGSPNIRAQTSSYGRFYLEQTLDGSKTTLSRYRGSVHNPLVVSTIGGLASVMGTNALLSSEALTSSSYFRLESPKSEQKNNSTSTLTKFRSNTFNGNNSGNTSSSSDNCSISSNQKRLRNGTLLKPILSSENPVQEVFHKSDGNADCDPEEQDSGIVIVNGKVFSLHLNNSRSQTPEPNSRLPPEVVILPGTPTEKSNDKSLLEKEAAATL